jgi:cytoskeletal protein RodZ
MAKTIGTLLSDARRAHGYSIEELSDITRIRTVFLEHLEEESWEQLPAYPVVFGFVRNISSALDLDEAQALAFFRRDYPPQKHTSTFLPKPDVTTKLTFGPRLFFVGFGFLAILAFLGYLVFQYLKFVNPPFLVLYEPADGAVITSRELVITGKADPESVVRVNNQPVLLDPSGTFSTTIDVSDRTATIEAKAVSRAGKETIVTHSIKPNIP